MQKKLGDVLIERGVVTQDQVKRALARQEVTGSALGAALVELGFTTEDQLTAALADQQDVVSWDLTIHPPEPDALPMLPADFCASHRVIPIRREERVLVLGMRHPGDLGTIDAAQAIARTAIRAVQVADRSLAWSLHQYYGIGLNQEDAVGNLVSQALDEYTAKQDEPEAEIVTEEETRPVIGLVDGIIADAIAMKASDVHLEPQENGLEIRCRVDGRLIKVREIPRALMAMVVARIKIMADMDVADHRLPQDGRIEVRKREKSVDLRVSLFPCRYGSRIVFRLLDRANALRGLDELGFHPENLRLFRELAERPYGMVLVTGPTGSGKTTTLYAALNELKSEETNILTCEDPIEYELPGISQSQVHDKIGLTFAAQLRSILRQDPDVVLVGEIRDGETASIAIKAALTGHMVLSTLHANDAPNAIPRLLDMGVEPFLVSSALSGVVAQRLIRTLCPECRQLGTPSERDLATMRTLGCEGLDLVWQAQGCPVCNGIGYKGRAAVHEILPVVEEVQSLIARNASVDTIREAALAYGYRPMQMDARDRVLEGRTTFEEVRRVLTVDTLGTKAKAAA